MSKVILYQGQPGATATTVIGAANITRTIDAAWVCNPTGGAVTLSVHMVESGGSVANNRAIYHEKSIGAGETVALTALVNQCIAKGATVSMTAGSGASLTVTVSGREQ